MTRWQALATILALTLTPHLAMGQNAEQGAMDRFDAAFGQYVVGPLAKVLFWDVAFWDNELPQGEGIGQIVDGKEVIAWDGSAYVLAQRWDDSLQDVSPAMKDPIKRQVGKLSFEVRQDKGGLVGRLLTAAPPSQLRPDTLSPWDALSPQERSRYTLLLPTPEGVTLQSTDSLAPFPVPVAVLSAEGEDGTVTTTQALVPFEIGMPNDLIPLAAGSRVRGSKGLAEVVTVVDDTLTLRSVDTETAKDLTLPNPKNLNLPIIVMWLVFGAAFFTLRMQFINLRGFRHAIAVTAGKYDNEHDEGEITHFQALSAALSATVGLGNIAGVAIAVGVGGPGAIFWMIVAGFLGMSSKFVECTLGQMYRTVDEHGQVLGGPMRYLKSGLEEMGMGKLGAVLAGLFAVMCIGGSFGGGNMFQANQSYQAVAERLPWMPDWAYGLLLAALVGMVIIGGVKRIGAAASTIVPVMCGVYVLAGLWILLVNAAEVPHALGVILSEAFTPEAGRGGLIGVLVQGFRRAAFSNEAGVGSASIAHSAASTDEPVREGIVALLEPFIDTIIVCTMTGLVVVVTGAYKMDVGDGVLMTSAAFESVISWFPIILTVAVVLFAFSTMISWSYYGERCWTYIFGQGKSMLYRVIFLVFVFLGSVFKLGNVLDFSDLMILGMAFPNIFGAILLSGKVRRRLDDYWGRYRSGEMKPVK